MTSMEALARRYSIYMGIIIVLLLLVALITSMSTFFVGMAFGTAFGLINFVTTYFQVKRIMTSYTTRKYRFSIGTLGRLLIVLVALFIAQAFPQYFDMTGVIAGLAVMYVILLIDPIFQIKHLQ
ncbi:ATP synthase subunit I [Alkalicoccus saliphilus]|jgi:ATP synthase protein I|nr:ATP synthase subunit I [Alkalicoccus saliphilus]